MLDFQIYSKIYDLQAMTKSDQTSKLLCEMALAPTLLDLDIYCDNFETSF